MIPGPQGPPRVVLVVWGGPPWIPFKAPAFRGERGAPPGLAQWSRPPGRVAPAVAPWPSVLASRRPALGLKQFASASCAFALKGRLSLQ